MKKQPEQLDLKTPLGMNTITKMFRNTEKKRSSEEKEPEDKNGGKKIGDTSVSSLDQFKYSKVT